MAVIGTQLTLVLLAAPAATAGAICLDRSRGTLTHLLVTDLTDREIVLGKLAARLAPILVLVAATLPVMELLTLLGGVDPDALLGAFVVTLGVAVLGCCLALVFSIRVRRTHEALLATYAVWGLWLLGTPMLEPDQPGDRPVPERPAARRSTRSGWRSPPTGGLARWAGKTTWPSSPGLWGISAVLALIRGLDDAAGLHARRRAEGARVGRGGWTSASSRPRAWRPGCSAGRDRPWTSTRSCGASGTATGRRDGRGSSPGRSSRWRLTFSVMAISAGNTGVMPPWVNALQVSIGLLFLSVTAATSLAEERVRGSLDVLMTTPMDDLRRS